MALIRCPECGNSISDRAEKCPHCGLPASYFSSLSKNTPHMKEAGLDYKNLQNVLTSFERDHAQLFSAEHYISHRDAQRLRDTYGKYNESLTNKLIFQYVCNNAAAIRVDIDSLRRFLRQMQSLDGDITAHNTTYVDRALERDGRRLCVNTLKDKKRNTKGEHCMNMIECFGLESLTEKEESGIALLNAVCSEGKAIVGYYGYPYFNREYGWAQFIVRTELNEKEKRIEITGLDTHLSGIATWDVLLSGMDLQPKDADCLSRRVVVKRVSDGGGLAIVNLVNADVLPSFLENDQLHIQMVGFPEEIHYLKNEEEYAAAQPETEDKKKFLLADGTVFPSGLFQNHALDNPDKDKDHYSDNLMLIRGTVKEISPGRVVLGGKEFTPFLCAVINTEFGDLEIVHTLAQVNEPEQDNIRVGATVWGVFVLSGDAAIDDYAEGIVLDEEHNLALLRYTLQTGNPRRLKNVLTEDAVYVSEASRQAWNGRDAIMDRLQYVRDANPDMECFAYLATVTSIDDGEEPLPYGAGKRCVTLSEGKQDIYNAIVFIDQDDSHHITRLTVSRNARYHFQIDEPIEFVSSK